MSFRVCKNIISMIFMMLIVPQVSAKIYQCISSDGKVSMQDKECSSFELSTEIDQGKLTKSISIIAEGESLLGHFASNRIKNAHFKNGLEFWTFDSDPRAFNWFNTDGHKGIGALSVQSEPPENPQKRRIYEVKMSQCVKLDQGRVYRFAASFKAAGQYRSNSANRVNLIWYQTEDCSRYGQSADYLQPTPNTHGWQRIVHEGRLRSLNAKAALITIVQSRITGNNQKAIWDDIELTPTEMEDNTKKEPNINHQYTMPIGQNYLKNGDFKFNLESWRHSGDTSWAFGEGGNAPGAARLAILSENGGYGAYNFSQCINIGTNKYFVAGAKVKVDSKSTQQGGGLFRFSWYEDVNCQGRNQAGFKNDRVENIKGWQNLTVDGIEAPLGTQSVNINITRAVNDRGIFAYFFDDVFFKAVDR